MKALKMTVLVVGVLLYANAAYGMTPLAGAAVTAVIGTGLELISQAVVQINSTADWATGKNLTDAQVKQVQAAIDYLNKKGFVTQAQQAQTLLDNSKSNSWTSSTFVYREGGKLDMALTSGGPINALPFVNNGHITLYQNFFGVKNHDGIAIDSSDKRARDQAQTLVHELDHLNSQANREHIYLLNLLTDWERQPLQTQVESLKGLGYTPDEIQTIRDTWAKGPYKKYVSLIDKVLEKPDTPTTAETTPPNTDEAKPIATSQEPKSTQSPKTDETTSGAPQPNTPQATGDKGGDRSASGYNPLGDANLKNTDKPVNTTEASNSGNQFQNPPGTQPSGQNVIPQPKDYGTPGQAPGDATTGDKTLPPPYGPPPYVQAPPYPPSGGPGPASDPGRGKPGSVPRAGGGAGGGGKSKTPRPPTPQAPTACPPGLHIEASEPEKGCH